MRIGKLVVSPIFPAVLLFFVIIDGTVYSLFFAASILIHEAAHVLAMAVVSKSISEVRLSAFGIAIEPSGGRLLGYVDEVMISLAGPVASFAAATAVTVYAAYVGPFEGSLFFAVANLALGMINILPVSGLDGGAALRSALCLSLEPDAADRVCFTVSVVLLIPIFIAGAYLLAATGYNFSLMLIALYLAAVIVFRR